jgi:uncharacterized membrane-anchored protein
MRPTTAKVSKVPEITLVFWIIKIAATRLGDTLSMSMDLGYLLSTAVFGAIFVAAIIAQIRATRFLPFLYWTTLIATTTLGTTLADCADRSLGIGYAGETSLLVALLALSLLSWQRSLGSISIHNVSSPKADLFLLDDHHVFSNARYGTRRLDCGLGGARLRRQCGLVQRSASVVCAHYYWASASRALLFWLAFILTGPLGAFLGDFFDKPVTAGGFALSRYAASAVLVAFCVSCILLSPQRAAKQAH